MARRNSDLAQSQTKQNASGVNLTKGQKTSTIKHSRLTEHRISSWQIAFETDTKGN